MGGDWSEMSDRVFGAVLQSQGIPRPVEEYRFAPPRRWRFDFAWPDERVYLEIEGGLTQVGQRCPVCGRTARVGHASIRRALSDLEKYNAATLAGWSGLRVTPSMHCRQAELDLITAALDLAARTG